jgi:hypothetical protein
VDISICSRCLPGPLSSDGMAITASLSPGTSKAALDAGLPLRPISRPSQLTADAAKALMKTAIGAFSPAMRTAAFSQMTRPCGSTLKTEVATQPSVWAE